MAYEITSSSVTFNSADLLLLVNEKLGTSFALSEYKVASIDVAPSDEDPINFPELKSVALTIVPR